MQNGERLITSIANLRDKPYAKINHDNKSIQLRFHLFWILVQLRYIYQQYNNPFNYILTKKGKELKFKK
jgi:hypothetical protein